MQTPVSFVVVYACIGKMDTQKCLSLFDQEENCIMFCVDFNARGCQRGNVHISQQGVELVEALWSLVRICITNGRVTRMAKEVGR